MLYLYTMRTVVLLIYLLFGIDTALAVQNQNEREVLVDDFEADENGDLPHRWRMLRDKKLVPLKPSFMRPDEEFYVVEEDGNRALRVFSEGEAVHIMMENGDDGFDWNINEFPKLAWDWRARQLPENAREDDERMNDSGAALYVIFKMEGLIIRRPKAIKYVYSSTLPVGAEVSYGKLKVLVVASAIDGIGDWVHIERDVLADYRRLFRADPPRRPLSLRLWSDSDNTDTPAEAYFDNIKFLSAR
ncbi:MAG: DUF3047 domain-containing protein [Rhodothermia bacterium]|nr:MAG: DUF3047 domain-containing protein [Rhodothermia bacterium]